MSGARTYGATPVRPTGYEGEESRSLTGRGTPRENEEDAEHTQDEAIRQLAVSLRGAGYAFLFEAVVTLLRAVYVLLSVQEFPFWDLIDVIDPISLCSLSFAGQRALEESVAKKTSGTPAIKILTKIFYRAQMVVFIPTAIALVKLCLEVFKSLRALDKETS
uniref:Uncharacterized protein n=1 Tax=Chromera velia CCMP2878 TaxID=1169474 RepID=A0A0G4G2F9_9ALVE|eukprot:Cvel_19968.t1-p1 / transcript=Cvel_19968.t1 / gene=Cvel_19968 / organism=Chromera_velia_CCMP2878 / gene_product=hypothetical protein / transcript_product=hypothetical protein / location=Cvel_scaffold1758:15153-15635(+) / protein_length=161 / sequence_SO=supercontig / SO=protein_coding / is_pseudo=false